MNQRELLAILAKSRVDFIVIGDVAAAAQDLDVIAELESLAEEQRQGRP